ncbi:MAG: inorganic phosphate transporter [Terracidiphilus sp.]
MADLAALVEALPATSSRPATAALPPPVVLPHRGLHTRAGRIGLAIFLAALSAGLCYIAFHVARDLSAVSIPSVGPFLLLGLALLIALGFEFVNGFHDTANAVATVIYTHSLEPSVAVVWSGLCNLAGVITSSGTVAFAVITLLPVELILQVSSGAGFAMVFSLLIAAILWNLGTWWFGLPASSSHTMVGSILGVGLANQLMNFRAGTSGVDWEQATKVFKALIISPLVGFAAAALLLLFFKLVLKFPAAVSAVTGAGAAAGALLAPFGTFGALWAQTPLAGRLAIAVLAGLFVAFVLYRLARFLANYPLFSAPKGYKPPPFPVRAMMILTCTGVSFYHGSNDGQKGMGLIMLILIGTVPTAYALNHAFTPRDAQQFVAISSEAGHILDRHVDPRGILGPDARAEVTDYLRTRQLQPDTVLALRELVEDLDHEVALYGAFKAVPAAEQTNVRNDMYVASEALRLMAKTHNPAFTPQESAVLDRYKSTCDKATKYIPDWVKVAVALALGLGTMVGWRRIVVTVGEKIGKQHLAYAQGLSAELVAMCTIFAANTYGLPVSTTHILSSGVAGTMAANGSGIHLTTVRNIAVGWVFTLPAAALLSGLLYLLFHSLA